VLHSRRIWPYFPKNTLERLARYKPSSLFCCSLERKRKKFYDTDTRTLDLGENSISSIKNGSFEGLNNLYGLRLSGNQVQVLQNLFVMQFNVLLS